MVCVLCRYMLLYNIYLWSRAINQTRFGGTLFGRSDSWALTAILAGVVGKIAYFTMALPIVLLSEALHVDATVGFSGSRLPLNVVHVFGSLIIAPIIESAIVLFTVWLFRKGLKASSVVTIVTSGAVHVPLHGLAIASLATFPVFALHAIIQLNWLGRGRAFMGYLVIVAAHAITNVIALGGKALLE